MAERGRRRIRMLLAAGALCVTLFAGYPLMNRLERHETMSEASTVTMCDQLAANPSDTQKLTIGVSQDQLNILAARAACEQALAARPEDGRLLYQLSRTFTGDQDRGLGLTYLRRSAESGYAQGQFTLAVNLIRGSDHGAKICEGGQLLIKAAQQRHFYAKVYLGGYWLDGTFRECGLPLTDIAVANIIGAARELAATPEEKRDLAGLEAQWKNH